MTDHHLHALVLRLRAVAPGSLMPHVGHQLQAMFLKLLQEVSPAVAAQLHADKQGLRWYTVAPLRLPRLHNDRLPLRLGETISARITLLQGELFGTVMHALLQQTAQARLTVGQLAFTLDEVAGTAERDPWAGWTTWETLATAARPAQYINLQFATPTAIGQGSDDAGKPRVELLPQPAAIFASLARRWNDLAPAELHTDLAAVRAAAETALVADYELRTITVAMAKGLTKGFYGQVSYELRGSEAQRQLLAQLADASLFLGVGMKTARGMGLCRRLIGR